MLLEEMIHAFWRDSTPLSSVVPPERFFTGPVDRSLVPGVVLIHEQSTVLCHTNRPEPWQKILLRFEILHESHESGAEVARLVEESFDRLRLNTPDGGRSWQFQFIESKTQPVNENVWKFIRRFQLIGQ